MMAMLSIPTYKSDDPNYRYKMPQIVARVEGRGNGIRTNISNMANVARALKRSPDYTTRFCGTELGTQSKYDPAEGKAIVNGAHEQKDIQFLIDKFIEKYVLCHHCQLPETDLIVKKQRVEYLCNACGSKGECDPSHKLTAFILKNPPANSISTLGSKKKERCQKEDYIKSKHSNGSHLSKSKQHGELDSSDETQKKDKKSHKKDSKHKTKSSKENKQNEVLSDKQTDVGSSGYDYSTGPMLLNESTHLFMINPKENYINVASRSKDKAKTSEGDTKDSSESSIEQNENDCLSDNIDTKKSKNKSKNSSQTKNLAVLNALEPLTYDSPEIKEIIESLSSEIVLINQSNKLEIDDQKYTPSMFNENLRLIQIAQGLDHRLKFYVALNVIFSQKLRGLTGETLNKRIKYLRPVAETTPSPKDILIALEDFAYLKANTCIVSEGPKAYSAILYAFYHNDIVTGEAVTEFYSTEDILKKHLGSVSKSVVEAYNLGKEYSQPFIEWFTSDEDGDEDE